MRNYFSKNRGVTLVEMLVYLALFGLIFLSIIEFALTISEGNRVAGRRMEIEKTVIFATQHLEDTFGKAVSIDEVNSTFDSAAGKLRLNLDAGYAEYNIASGRLNFDNSGETNFLSSSDYVIDQFYLERILRRNGTLQGVRLTLQISSVKDVSVTTTVITSYTLK